MAKGKQVAIDPTEVLLLIAKVREDSARFGKRIEEGERQLQELRTAAIRLDKANRRLREARGILDKDADRLEQMLALESVHRKGDA